MTFKKSSFCTNSTCVEVEFIESSFCANSGCVKVAIEPDLIRVRDTNGVIVSYDADEWRAFIAGVKNNEFDLPE